MNTLSNNLKKNLSKITGTPQDRISDQTHLFDELDLDSFGVIELFVMIEKDLNIKLNPVLYYRKDFETLSQLTKLVETQSRLAPGV